MRGQLSSLPIFAGDLPDFDPVAAPAEPVALFAAWLAEAVAAGVSEPHAMTVSTVDAQGAPDARIIVLHDLDERGWLFVAGPSGAKIEQLATEPRVALSFYWREQGRQVRVRGEAVELTPRPADHLCYAVTPATIDFWQGYPGQRHIGLRYLRDGDAWTREAYRRG